MAAASASSRGQRTTVLASVAAAFIGWRLAVDCGDPACGGERADAISAMVALHGGQHTLGAVPLRLRCRICGQPPQTVLLETSPELSARGRLRMVALRGPDDERQSRNF